MRLVLTGAGGGHFYPLIAVAEAIEKEAASQKILEVETFFLSDKPYDKSILEKKNIKFIKVPAGKLRLYFSIKNIFDPLKSFFGFFVAIYRLFIIYPDVVFAKGGYSSMPVVLAAKCLFIPIFVHESDSVPGRTNLLAGRLAKRIAVSYAGAIKYFNLKKVAYTGQPILEEYSPSQVDLDTKLESLKNFNEKKKNLLVLGGSQGSEIINNMILASLPELLNKYNIFHQVGVNNLNTVKISVEFLMKDSPNKDNYKYFAFGDLSPYYRQADICITRAGSSLFELSAWGIPSIIVPITNSNMNHQTNNAFVFEKSGCSIVIEEINFKQNLFLNMVENLLDSREKYLMMRNNNLSSFKAGASQEIAEEIVKIALSHN